MEGRNPNMPTKEGENINPNQFRRPCNPSQILQRERRNKDDQNIQPPFQNNFIIDSNE